MPDRAEQGEQLDLVQLGLPDTCQRKLTGGARGHASGLMRLSTGSYGDRPFCDGWPAGSCADSPAVSGSPRALYYGPDDQAPPSAEHCPITATATPIRR